MTTIKTLVKRRPVLTYFALTFAISWGGVLILGAPYGMPAPSEQFNALWPIVFVPYFLGPSVTGVVLTGLLYGRAGLRDLLSRLLRWRVGARWYAIALLIAPLLITTILLVLSLTSPVFLPDIVTKADKISLLLTGIAVGLLEGGLLEELGWTGFATPEIRRRYSILATGLIIGVLWAVWHLLPAFWGSGDASGALSLSLLLPQCLYYVGVLPAYRVLMVWVYDHTESLLVAILMHASLTASTVFILLPGARGIPLMVYYLILTAVMWAVVAAVAVANRGQLSRQPAREGLVGI